MEAVELLALIVVLVVSLAIFRGRSGAPRQPTIKVRDPAVARHALIDQADAFSNRPATPFPVPLITSRRRRRYSHGIITVAYGPHWRALRSNLTATILQPWRQGLQAPIRREAVAALVTGLTADDMVVHVVRDSVYTAVFAMLTRVCFGDGVDEPHVRSMERMMQEFRVAIGESKAFARSTRAKLVHWKQWRRFLAFRGEQAALFLPLIEAARRRRRSGSGGGGGGGIRPYVDSLVDLRVPDDEDDARATKRALTDDEMVSLMVEFLGAVETIVASVEWTMAHLVAQPDVQKKLRHEIVTRSDHGSVSEERPGRLPYLHAVVLESLRLHPPFPLVMRDVRAEGATVGAATVPAGGNGLRVQFMLGDIARDANMWTNPHHFRPERFLAGGEGEGVGLVPAGPKEIRMMPFGAGQRSCPGAALGVLYIETFLAALVCDFEWTIPAECTGDGGGVDMTELYGFITVMKSPLRARMTPARP